MNKNLKKIILEEILNVLEEEKQLNEFNLGNLTKKLGFGKSSGSKKGGGSGVGSGLSKLFKGFKLPPAPPPGTSPTIQAPAPQEVAPQVPKGPASLLFDGVSLSWRVGNQVVKSWKATSGKNPWASKSYMKAHQQESNFGAIPEGNYRIGALEKNGNQVDPSVLDTINYAFAEIGGVTQGKGNLTPHSFGDKTNPYTQIAWGKYRIPIIGGKYGRGSFFIHGGTLPGSSGCIDLGNEGMDSFVEFVTQQKGSKLQGIPLEVNYN